MSSKVLIGSHHIDLIHTDGRGGCTDFKFHLLTPKLCKDSEVYISVTSQGFDKFVSINEFKQFMNESYNFIKEITKIKEQKGEYTNQCTLQDIIKSQPCYLDSDNDYEG